MFNTKLFYVACSRAIKNLKIIKIIKSEEEEEKLKEFFLEYPEFIEKIKI